MQIKLLCLGDVVGRAGRHILSQKLPALIKQRQIDCVIANVENAAGGSGLTPQIYNKLRSYGVDLMSLGDHIYRKKEIYTLLQNSEVLVRPANFPPEAVGREVAIGTARNGAPVALISLMGRIYMNPTADCPFHAIDRVLSTLERDVRIVVVDIHAEATSEKIAMGWYLDGRVSVVFGTHTHVPTADECILPHGTAYITDLGMTGPYNSVLGRKKERVIKALTTSMPHYFEVATGDPRMCGIIVTVETTTGRAERIERICIASKASSHAAYDVDDGRASPESPLY